MPMYRVTITRRVLSNGIVLEPGMTVDVSTRTTTNPISVNNGELVKAAFMRIYGIDLNRIWMTAKSAMQLMQVS